MGTQYRDGSFGEIRPLPEALQEFLEANEAGLARSFHVGTEEEIKEIQKSEDFKSALADMHDRLKELEAKNSIIKKATDEQVKAVTGEYPKEETWL